MKQAHQGNILKETQQNEEKLYVAFNFSTNSSKETWLMGSGCINRMIYYERLLKYYDESVISKVKIGNVVDAIGKCEVVVDTTKGTKIISDVLYVPKITENFLRVRQMLEKVYLLNFSNKSCIIYDSQSVKC